jgi:hypothetical protein
MTVDAPASWPVRAPEPTDRDRQVAVPTLSVVIAAYQAEQTVAEAIESVLCQTSPALEIVVCDDGSTDGTGAVLASFTDRIRVIRQDNAGEAAAKNTAVRAARGDFVVVLDADDVCHPQRLEALGWLASRRPDLDVLTTDAFLEVGGRVIRRAYGPFWRFETEDQRREILVRNFILGLAAVRRARWLDVGGFDEGLHYVADWDFWQRLILGGSRVGLVEAPLVTYRLAVGSLSADRARLVAGRVSLLERTASLDGLSDTDRDAVATALAAQRRLLALQRARAALRTESPEIRRHSLTVARTRGLAPRTRLKALVAAAAPGWAASRYREGTGGSIEVGAGIWVDGDG